MSILQRCLQYYVRGAEAERQTHKESITVQRHRDDREGIYELRKEGSEEINPIVLLILAF